VVLGLFGVLAVVCILLAHELRVQKEVVASKHREIERLQTELQSAVDRLSIAQRRNSSSEEELVEARKKVWRFEKESTQSVAEAARAREQITSLQKEVTAQSNETETAAQAGPKAPSGASRVLIRFHRKKRFWKLTYA